MALSFNRKLAYILGYTMKDFDPRYNNSPLIFPEYSTDDTQYLQEIIGKLETIDQELEANRGDSMAVDVGGVKVNFNQSILIAKQEGSRLLNQLAHISGVPLKFDKYIGRATESGSVYPIAVRNYF